MKKFLFALLGLVFAAPFAMADNIKMVTYFPVPYASYGDLSVSGTCDVGLLNNCSLDAGEKLNVYKLSSDGRVLNTGSLIANSGKLDLNSSASSSQINTTSLVSHNPGGQTASTGVLEFSHDLTIDTIKGATIQSAEATNRADMDALYLFGSSHRFPTCDGTGHKMSWQKLTVDGKSGVFLVCGEGTKPEETCEQNPNQKKCCTGSNPYWNGSSCIRKCSTAGNSQWKRQFSNWYWGKLGSYTSSLSTTGGDCPDEEGSFDKVINKSGISRVCDSGTSWSGAFSSDYVAQYLGLTCEQNALLDETEFECVYEAWYYNPNGNDCVAGVLKCQREEPETWTCPATQTCGTTKGSCK